MGVSILIPVQVEDEVKNVVLQVFSIILYMHLPNVLSSVIFFKTFTYGISSMCHFTFLLLFNQFLKKTNIQFMFNVFEYSQVNILITVRPDN